MATSGAACGSSGSCQKGEEKKNSHTLHELGRISHPHVYHYFHQLKDILGETTFPQDPNKLYQKFKTHERQIRREIKNDKQLQILFPDNSNETQSSEFDLTLFKLLIKTFGQTGKPYKFWDEEPPQNDTSEEAKIARLFVGRNLIQHDTPNVSNAKFKEIASGIINALISLGEDKNKLSNLLPPVQYHLLKPVSNFFGRTNDLDKIRTMVQNGKNDILRVVIHSMAGLGKSETVRKYCDQFGEFFDNNILWVNAANQTSIESSFIQIADMVELTIRDENGHLKEINSIINSVHKHFQSEQILYVFDDVSDIQSLTPFLPEHKSSASIITTQLKDWPQNNHFQMHELQTFDEAEGKSFLNDNLTHKKMDETQLNRILKQLGGHPLALQQFAVAITKTMLSVEEYLELLEKETAKILEKELITIQGGKSAIGAIRITLEKLAETKDSKLALDILDTISYFYVDEISFELLKLTFPDDVINIDNAVQKLESYSLIKRHDNIISIHSLIQKSIISQHKDKGDKYFQKCLKMFQNQLDDEEEKSYHESFGREWYKHLIYFISTNINNTEIHDFLYENFYNIFYTLKSKGRINDLINFIESLLKTSTEKNGPSHEKTFGAMFCLAFCYHEVRQYDKAIELYQNVLDRRTERYGKYNEVTLGTMGSLVGCFGEKGNVDEAKEMYKEVNDGYTKICGRYHQETLKTMINLAVCFEKKGNVDKGIEMNKKVLDEYTKIYGRYNQETLRTMNNLAACFKKKGNVDEAIEMNKEVLDEYTKIYGRYHQKTLRTISNLAMCFLQKGNVDEAIEINKEVLDGYKKIYGKYHQKTLRTISNLASCFLEKENVDEAIELNIEVLDGFTKIYGRYHQYTLQAMNNLALCFYEKGNVNEAIEMKKEVLDRQTKLYGKDNQETLRTMNDLAECLEKKGRVEKAKTLYEEASLLCKSSLDENHLLTNKIQNDLFRLENDEESSTKVEKRK